MPRKTKAQKKLEETIKQENKRWNAFNRYRWPKGGTNKWTSCNGNWRVFLWKAI